MSASPSGWLNRTVLGAGLTSFLADVSYELATALLPTFLLALGLPSGMAAQVLGAVEATADFLSNAAKLLVGWYSDRVGKRKTLVVAGYALTGSAFALCAVAAAWPAVLAAKSLAWLGKGLRGPLRNAIIADAVAPGDRGKAFGLHRAGDTLGAVVGPLLAAAVLAGAPADWFSGDPTAAYRAAFWFTLVPGLGSAVAFALLVREQRFTPKPGLRLGASVAALPREYRRFLGGVGLFGLGDFSHTLLILAAATSLAGREQAAVVAIALYAWRNLCQAAAAFPAGWLADRVGPVRVLVGGYLLGAAAMGGFGALVAAAPDSLAGWIGLFALAGGYMAVQEAVEPAVVPALVPDRGAQGTAFGVLAMVNGLGDVAASLAVGVLFAAAGPPAGFAYAAGLMLLGAGWLAVMTKGPG